MIELGTIICGDCLDVMRGWPDACVDAVICDPPYGLTSYSQAHLLECLSAWVAGEVYQPKGKGFMGQDWDGWVPGPEVWRECYRVLKDGGRMLAFSGARTQDLMTLAIRLAGFEIEDTTMWLYGQGFPKHKSKLKPAYEPICVARKGSVTELNIDAGRIGDEQITTHGSTRHGTTHAAAKGLLTPGRTFDDSEHTGRWPANVILDEASARLLDEQSGERVSGWRDTDKSTDTAGASFKTSTEPRTGEHYQDTGGASRFFYCAKASRAERNAGCGGLEPQAKYKGDGSSNSHDMFSGQGGSDEWKAKNPAYPQHNTHPTVKPLALMQWLIGLVTEQGDLILDPFCGSGSTLVAAERLGRRWIGIDIDEHWCEVSRKRTAQRGLFAEAGSE